MGRFKPDHYEVKRGRGFWHPTAKMRKAGFVHTACGEDGPTARAYAEELNARWLGVRLGQEPAPALAIEALATKTPGKKKKLTPEQADDLIPLQARLDRSRLQTSPRNQRLEA